ncbi:thioredoxin family protein [Alkalinema sp. FACHB-956]|uniref:TlpA family protein disulfide reductase n=1 Tax=Alkalinema sp. FACHB-956 TaxID=2692768 RepID=UPI0016889D3B|nr:thioredoxin family protein [Alkalinema sp. FACHB-956]MBD2329307.1 redoxin domain-containing protein [Alkalinema sp. FACHB-956]
MKIHYFALLAVVSLLSFGAIAGCSGSTTSQAPSSPTAEVASNPCAAKSNPCAAKPNPCAAKSNPCAAKSNPCAAKSNPCAAKPNPCAAKAKSVGAPLAQELQGKPVVVDVFATWCPACKNIAPTLSQLKKDYDGKVHFVVLDVSDKSTTSEAEATAKKLGLSQFLEMNKAQTGSLTIVNPATGEILAQHRNNANLADYTSVLDAALKQ